eukprot:860854-Pyramimonas_sp.AAC.1
MPKFNIKTLVAGDGAGGGSGNHPDAAPAGTLIHTLSARIGPDVHRCHTYCVHTFIYTFSTSLAWPAVPPPARAS